MPLLYPPKYLKSLPPEERRRLLLKQMAYNRAGYGMSFKAIAVMGLVMLMGIVISLRQ